MPKASPTKDRRKRRLEADRPLVLRPYQAQAGSDIMKACDEGRRRICACLPTGAGKTVLMMHIIDMRWKKGNNAKDPVGPRGQVLILVPTIQIVVQTKAVAEAILKGKMGNNRRVELEQRPNWTGGEADLTIATWQGLHMSSERLKQFEPEFFDMVIVDECHRAASPCFLRLLHYFNDEVELCEGDDIVPVNGFNHGNKVNLLGLSATPSRTDGYSVRNAFNSREHHVCTRPLIKNGTLSELTYRQCKPRVDLKKALKKPDNEHERDEVQWRINRGDADPFEHINRSIIHHYRLHQRDKRRYFLVFCRRLRQVWSLKAAFEKANIVSKTVSGATSLNERAKTLAGFQKGEFPVLINCGVLIEGADLPCVDTLVLARPTRSRNMMTQMVGRGMRVSKDTGKHNCLILDLTVSETYGMWLFPRLCKMMKNTGGTFRDAKECRIYTRTG